MIEIIICGLAYAMLTTALALYLAQRFFGKRLDSIEDLAVSTYEGLQELLDDVDTPEACEDCGGPVVDVCGPGRSVQVSKAESVELGPNVVTPRCVKCGKVQDCEARDIALGRYVREH